jgi:hypothetical protein
MDAAAAGHGEEDFVAVVTALERLADHPISS